jgi:hypothetical protein
MKINNMKKETNEKTYMRYSSMGSYSETKSYGKTTSYGKTETYGETKILGNPISCNNTKIERNGFMKDKNNPLFSQDFMISLKTSLCSGAIWNNLFWQIVYDNSELIEDVTDYFLYLSYVSRMGLNDIFEWVQKEDPIKIATFINSNSSSIERETHIKEIKEKYYKN